MPRARKKSYLATTNRIQDGAGRMLIYSLDAARYFRQFLYSGVAQAFLDRAIVTRIIIQVANGRRWSFLGKQSKL